MTSLTRKNERGFTLIELFVALAILGVVLTLALPRFLNSRRNAFVAEADNILQELKSLAWGYQHQYGTWDGITPANMSSTLGFVEPPDAVGCWDYSLVAPTIATQIQFLATGDDTPTKCSLVNTGTVTLILYSNGSSTRTLVLP